MEDEDMWSIDNKNEDTIKDGENENGKYGSLQRQRIIYVSQQMQLEVKDEVEWRGDLFEVNEKKIRCLKNLI